MYEYAEGCEYKSLDAVIVAGDFTGGGAEKEYEMFNKIIKENKKDETQLLTILGNHEFIDYRDVDATVGYDVYRKYVNEDVDTDIDSPEEAGGEVDEDTEDTEDTEDADDSEDTGDEDLDE
jgi:hypothetical protein